MYKEIELHEMALKVYHLIASEMQAVLMKTNILEKHSVLKHERCGNQVIQSWRNVAGEILINALNVFYFFAF